MRKFGNNPPRPVLIETENANNRGYVSILRYGQLRTRSLPDEVFTLEYLPDVAKALLQ